MKPLVYQIVIGELPKELHRCVNSVKLFAIRNNYEYLCDTEMPQWAKDIGMRPREASEWLRADKLASRPYVLWVDWDIAILKDFELKEEIITVPTIDSLLYYGADINLANRILLELGDKTKKCKEWAIIYHAFKKIYNKDIRDSILHQSFFEHISYTMRKDYNILF